MNDGEEHFQKRKEGLTENCREGQTLPLRQVPQAKPEAGKDARSVVLLELLEGKGRLGPVMIRGLPQHKDGFLALRVSLPGGREANLLDDEAALLEYPEGRSVAGGGSGDQGTLGDFLQQ